MKESCRYRNPVLPCDFSDPDAIRVGADYYMIASSFHWVPGVPVLHSRDLVHWERIGYCVRELPFERYRRPTHGCGTWAPSLRYRNRVFYAFIPLPDEGIFVTQTTDPAGIWTPLRCVKKASGWIDPCPLWDEDGQVYMAHAFAKSRCGIKHKIQMSRLDPKTLEVTDDGPVVFDGIQTQPTAEGPKLYKRGGWYYIFIPAGGVATGWQTALRSRNIYGPYEEKIVLHQGNTAVNGPHQGAWVTDPDGRDWFLHFQDAGAAGRVVHLQPMCWREDWPFIGQEQNGDGIGEPVENWECPVQNPGTGQWNGLQLSDDFKDGLPGLAWQWQANPQENWIDRSWNRDNRQPGLALKIDSGSDSLWRQPNVLSQMLPGPDCCMEVRIKVLDGEIGARAGMAMLGRNYTFAELLRTGEGWMLQLGSGKVESDAPEAKAAELVLQRERLMQEARLVRKEPPVQEEQREETEKTPEILLAARVTEAKYVQFYVNGKKLGGRSAISCGVWTGARVALYARGSRNGGRAVFSEFTVNASRLSNGEEQADEPESLW